MKDKDFLYVMKKRKMFGNVSKALYLEPSEGVKKLQSGKFAFYCEAPICYDIIYKMFRPHEICDLKEIDTGTEYVTGLVVSKHSPLREIISRNFLRVRESGIFKKHKIFWYGVKPRCRQNNLVTSVGYEYVGPLIFALLIAYIVAVLILIIELVCEAKGRKKSKLQMKNTRRTLHKF